MSLPIVDFAQAGAGEAIVAGLAEHGFLQLRNIGIARAELEKVFAASEAFFTGPPERKQQSAYRSAAENFGYQGLCEEHLDPTAPADLKETFTMRDILRQMPQDSRWPSASFRDIVSGFYAKALSCAHDIQRAMAPALGKKPDYFANCHNGELVTLRLLHYPSLDQAPDNAAQLGAGAHSDYGFMTLLFQHEVGGLQVRGRDGEWIDVPPDRDAVVLNAGDLLERWSNGRLRSTLHRVQPNRSGLDRYSIAMFLDPDADTLVEALPSCIAPGETACEAPVLAGDYLLERIAASHKGRFEA